jgi:hypothetical protein
MTGTIGPAGGRRATRVSRTAARQAKRQRAKRRQQLIGAGLVIALLLGGATYAIVAGSRDSARRAGSAGSAGSDSGLLKDAGFLLEADGAQKMSAGAWTVTSTASDSETPDRSFGCQAQRFADPAGVRTWVRMFKNPTAKTAAVEYIELSGDADGAQRAYSTIVSWLSACTAPPQRLVASYNADGIADRGIVAVFAEPLKGQLLQQRYRVLTVASTGPATMVFEYVATGAAPPATAGTVGAASDALKKLCLETRTGCPRTLELKPELLLASSEPPGFLAPIDLPVMPALTPWVGVDMKTNQQTDCNETVQSKSHPKRAKARTYVTPESSAPTEFGLDTKIYEFGTSAEANAYLTAVRGTLDKCKTSNLKTKRTLVVSDHGGVTGQTWKVTSELSNGKDLIYRVGVARAGQRVVYLLFLVIDKLDFTDRAFADVVARAGQRSLSFK